MTDADRYALHSIGWKAFQDLCADLIRVHWQAEVEVYSPTRDQGVDGVVTSSFKFVQSQEIREGAVIQCKHSASATRRLTASSIEPEVEKIRELVRLGVSDYVLLSNMKVSQQAATDIKARLASIGIQKASIYGGEWIAQILTSTPQLRALVPRVYGLGDFSWIVDERRLAQTTEILSGLKHELSLYVTTDAHRRAVNALVDHSFVLILGDPASGKSSIAAVLAAAALDLSAQNVVRVFSPHDIVDHWNPLEKNRFFWIDDAFGATQFQAQLADAWNKIIPTIRAATSHGNRFVLTSRNYIWNQAKNFLKTPSFQPLTSGQVIIDLQKLTVEERHQILYNHVKFGDQPATFKKSIKPHLKSIAEHPNFLPETARRLGSQYFTQTLTKQGIGYLAFVENPKQILVDVLGHIGSAERAAVALVFASGGRCQSPLVDNEAMPLVSKLFGAQAADIVKAAESLDGALLNRVVVDGLPAWIFKHPTVGDAFTDYLKDNPELADLFISGAKLEIVLQEVVCGDMVVFGSNIFATAKQQQVLLERLSSAKADWKIAGFVGDFLSARADRAFLLKVLAVRPTLVYELGTRFSRALDNRFLRRLAEEHKHEALPDLVRQQVQRAIRSQLMNGDVGFFRNEALKEVLGVEAIAALIDEAKEELLPVLDQMVIDVAGNVESDVEVSDHFDDISSTLWVMEELFHYDEDAMPYIEEANGTLKEKIAEANEQREREAREEDWARWEEEDAYSRGQRHASAQSHVAPEASTISIFDDVDD